MEEGSSRRNESAIVKLKFNSLIGLLKSDRDCGHPRSRSLITHFTIIVGRAIAQESDFL
jgi:hypothetical protein